MSSKEVIIDQLSSVWGISVKSATHMYENQGIKSITELRQSQDSLGLTKHTKVYLEHYKDLSQRIPRNEITHHINAIQNWWEDYNKQRDAKSVDLIMKAVGSYRRGEPTSGDIDLVIHIRNTKDRLLLVNPIGFFHHYLSHIQKYILHVFQLSENTIKALVRLSPKTLVRRLDIFFAYGHDYPFFLLAKTGDVMFTKTMRQKVKNAFKSQLNSWETMVLSEHGFRIKDRDGNYKMYRPNSNFHDEYAIFRFLGINPPLAPSDYKESFPYEINVMDVYRPLVLQKRSKPSSSSTVVSWSSSEDSRDSSKTSRRKKRRKNGGKRNTYKLKQT